MSGMPDLCSKHKPRLISAVIHSVTGIQYRTELFKTLMMRDMLKKMRIPETKVLQAHEKAFKDLKYLYDLCNETLDVSFLDS